MSISCDTAGQLTLFRGLPGVFAGLWRSVNRGCGDSQSGVSRLDCALTALTVGGSWSRNAGEGFNSRGVGELARLIEISN